MPKTTVFGGGVNALNEGEVEAVADTEKRKAKAHAAAGRKGARTKAEKEARKSLSDGYQWVSVDIADPGTVFGGGVNALNEGKAEKEARKSVGTSGSASSVSKKNEPEKKQQDNPSPARTTEHRSSPPATGSGIARSTAGNPEEGEK